MTGSLGAKMAYQYKVMGKVVELQLDPSVVAVRFKDDPPHSLRATASARAGAGPYEARIEVPGEKLTLVPVPAAATRFSKMPSASASAGIEVALSTLNAQPEVSIALPVFRRGANRVITTDRVIIGLSSVSESGMLAAKYALSLIEARDDTIVCQAPDGADMFALVEALDQESVVSFAEPDFVTMGPRLPHRGVGEMSVPSDPMLGQQYAMNITRAADAWTIVDADPKIKIAILDEGIDTAHPDLADAIVGTYDGIDDDSYQEPNRWDGHGTACAGLAAAIGGNSIGVRGVAGGCSILAVRIARSVRPGGPWSTTNSNIARSIRWSRENGADIISNSWGGGTPSNDIMKEFERARTVGRDGKGCVIVIAAGNRFDVVEFPGTLPDVLTVSASNEYDEAKTPDSSDGEDWGSNYGPEVDVAAPGVHNLTTDISSTGGYVGGDYAPAFNGTSSSTPIVAGACALVLSANPALTEQEVRDIIATTADKVGQFPYAGGRNPHFGQGRLNVLEAVLAARAAAKPTHAGARARRPSVAVRTENGS